MNRDERAFAGIAYIIAMIPLWGLVGDFVLWLYHKDSNEELAFHALQAVFLQAVALTLWVLAAIFQLFIMMVIMIIPALGAVLSMVNLVLFGFIWAGLAVAALIGAMNIFILGKDDFEFPIIGARLREGKTNLPEEPGEKQE